MTALPGRRGFSISGVSHGAGRGYDGRPITILKLEALLTDA
ncbi:hypothetical protein [Frigidibacter sp. ROC022]|nr:hypothetical protein [Frigidibacter sp. ROC022]MCR8724763.1 hypothetical protein [Frigidibacter sp. ROC022]